MTGVENVGVFIGEKVWLGNSLSQTFSRRNTPTFSNLVILHTYPPMEMEHTGCFETSAYKIQRPGNYPEESTKHLCIHVMTDNVYRPVCTLSQREPALFIEICGEETNETETSQYRTCCIESGGENRNLTFMVSCIIIQISQK
jgi:hypothetical protein